MNSKFTWAAFIPAFIIIALTASTIFCIVVCFYPAVASILIVLIPAIIFAVLVLLWLIYGELRTKIIWVELGFDHLTIKRYYGLSAPVTIYYADMDGFTISILPSTGATYEYLYLLKQGKKVGKLSEFYHKNYADLKAELQTHIKDLGYVDFSYLQEIKEIFN